MPAFLKWLAKAVHLDWCRLFSVLQYTCYPKSKIAKTCGAITLITDPERLCQGRGAGYVADYTFQT